MLGMKPGPKLTLTLDEAADAFGMGRGHLKRMAADGVAPHRHAADGSIVFDRAELGAALARRERGNRALLGNRARRGYLGARPKNGASLFQPRAKRRA